ncbi:MAG: CBS domain-containing protein [Thermoplasmatota archaeon]
MNVEEIMSKKLIVGYVPGTVKSALQILAEHNVSGIPVIKKGTDKLVGVVTRSDIFKNADEDQLAMILNEEYFYLKQGQDIKEAARLFYQKRIHGLPIINKNSKLIGILSPTDLLKELIKEQRNDTAGEHISNLVVPVHINTPINIIMEIINITNENALPVLDDALKVVGIVTDGDLFKLSQIKEGVEQSEIGIGDDEDQWTWEGIRDTVRMYHATSKVLLPGIPVKEVMIPDVKTATKNTPVCEIAKLMIRNNISHIPIVTSDNRLIGIVTDMDLMSCMM